MQYKKMTIEQLVILSKNNDYKALEELIKRVQKNIFATYAYLEHKLDNVYDLTQEALLKMAKGLPNLKNVKTFKSWLNQIVMHTYYDNLRKNNHLPNTVSIDDEFVFKNYSTNFKNCIIDKKCKPMENCISHELDCVIKTKMQRLPEHYRIPIVLRELQGLSYEEIAKLTQTTVGTVKSRISRARHRLKEDLKEYI